MQISLTVLCRLFYTIHLPFTILLRINIRSSCGELSSVLFSERCLSSEDLVACPGSAFRGPVGWIHNRTFVVSCYGTSKANQRSQTTRNRAMRSSECTAVQTGDRLVVKQKRTAILNQPEDRPGWRNRANFA